MTAIQSYRWALSLLLAGLVAPSVADTVNFDGTLIEDACEIYPGDEAVELDFGTVIDKYLYLNSRTHSQPFAIRLINCDLALGREVKVTFSGMASGALPGYLAFDSSSMAKGAAIGLENSAGELLAINSGKVTQPLQAGSNNALNLKAFVQGEPLALRNKSIQRGAFTATATFTLEYE
ncbi:fimbrial protein [Serratia fonticola]|uniref:fimbrial protein n=1 Tax=Serratia fonticola TaxID=47917 RepID=UPI002DB673CA|nr:fimbrial protein [Serratia fonticola]MEB7886675.1 type 1 fimbrial protein [Serratia fonticola]